MGTKNTSNQNPAPKRSSVNVAKAGVTRNPRRRYGDGGKAS